MASGLVEVYHMKGASICPNMLLGGTICVGDGHLNQGVVRVEAVGSEHQLQVHHIVDDDQIVVRLIDSAPGTQAADLL